MKADVILALGGNIGDVPATFAQALQWLQDRHILSNIAVASLYSSQSLLQDGQDDYTNTICSACTELEPLELLAKLKEAEAQFGRSTDTAKRWQARPLDIDIIDYNGKVIAEDGLDIPHLRMAERGFVLLPLRELCPSYINPRSLKSIDWLIADLADDQSTTKLYKYFDILLPVPTDGVYTYRSAHMLVAGQRVTVPFGKSRTTAGICLNETTKPDFECKDVSEVLDTAIAPSFPPIWLELLRRLADYYIAPLGAALHGVISQKVLASKPSEPYALKQSKPKAVTLSAEQQAVVDSISLDSYSAHLIQGITGSGKTEIYLDLMQKTMAKGKQTLYLVPEISLTPQLIGRLEERLGFKPLAYHSQLTDKRRNEAFWAWQTNQHPLLLGARSALFMPSSHLGLIIVDEEHESSFKQEEMPAYHLRDMAVLYAHMNNIPIVLGSATPQTESVENAAAGKYKIHYLRERFGNAKLPDIKLVDMRHEQLVGDVLAESIYDKLYDTVQAGKQAIIFLNRKGYATALFCKRCGRLHECANCSVPLTMYKSSGRSSCNYCGAEYRKLSCPDCGCEEVFDAGTGTERVEEFLEEMFPNAILRIDADKINTFKQLNEALAAFYDKKAQILVGTQLIAKGLHFPDLTFVGILGIDNILSIPDYRAVEKAYQLVMQVSGRAGRGESNGSVLIQTHMPEHELFQYFNQPPENFYTFEMERRRQFDYPPYSKMARLILSYSKQNELKQTAEIIAAELHRLNANNAAIIMGPAPAVVYKIKNQFRFSIIVKSKSHKQLTNLLLAARDAFNKHKIGSMNIKIDRDPYYFM